MKAPRHLRRPLWAGAALVAAVAAVGAAGPPGRVEWPDESRPGGTLYSIELPFEEPPRVPDGPNKAQFTAYCRLCHSPRMVLTQPRFPEKKWAEVVKKMVTVYGAPIPPDQEAAVVAYLTAVRGPAPAAKPR